MQLLQRLLPADKTDDLRIAGQRQASGQTDLPTQCEKGLFGPRWGRYMIDSVTSAILLGTRARFPTVTPRVGASPQKASRADWTPSGGTLT